MNYSQNELNYIKAIASKVKALEDQQGRIYSIMLKTRKTEGNDWLFDVIFNNTDINKLNDH